MHNQDDAPILEIIRRYLQDKPTAFYFPGHRGRSFDSDLLNTLSTSFLQADLPELPGIEEAIDRAQILAAKSVGADHSWFLTNGATIGVQAMFLAFAGAKVLVGRNCHRSALGGMILADTRPVYLPTEIDKTTGVDLGVSAFTLEQALKENEDAQAVFLVSPNYFGVCGDVKTWVKLCHDRSIPLLIDGAHGAHLGFHGGFPPSALTLGADVVVQSCHKTATALTQSAMLHLKSKRIKKETIGRCLEILKSTSPSLLLLASLDVSRRQMIKAGTELLDQLLKLSERLRSSLSWLISYDDPSRIIAIPPSGTGFALDQWLCQLKPPIIAELPTFQHLVLALTVGTKAEDIDRLIKALQTYPPSTKKKDIPLPDHFSIVKPSHSPREVYFAAGKKVKPEAAIDRISRGIVCPYPPGIPLLFPGEKITKRTIDYLQQTIDLGGIVQGWEGGIDVTDDSL